MRNSACWLRLIARSEVTEYWSMWLWTNRLNLACSHVLVDIYSWQIVWPFGIPACRKLCCQDYILIYKVTDLRQRAITCACGCLSFFDNHAPRACILTPTVSLCPTVSHHGEKTASLPSQTHGILCGCCLLGSPVSATGTYVNWLCSGHMPRCSPLQIVLSPAWKVTMHNTMILIMVEDPFDSKTPNVDNTPSLLFASWLGRMYVVVNVRQVHLGRCPQAQPCHNKGGKHACKDIR